MKYFNNVNSIEELKKEFRTLCITMHPDKGGDPSEFKTMLAEYQKLSKFIKDLTGRAEAEAEAEAEARRQAEEWRKEEEEERKRKEEEARKAAEAMRPVIAKWSAILERVPELEKYRKPSAAYIAAVKRNIKAVFAHYFHGVKVSVTLNNELWKEKAVITWTDGPTVAEVEDLEEFNHFIATEHVCDPYADYGDDVEVTYNKTWRQAFGEIAAQHFEFSREFSEMGKAEILNKIAEILPQFAGVDVRKGVADVSRKDTARLIKFFGFAYDYKKNWVDMTEEEKDTAMKFEHDHAEGIQDCQRVESSNYYGGATPLRCVVDLFRQYYTISAETTQAAKEAAEAPKFTPTHNATYKAIIKALGGNAFASSIDGKEWDERKPITPAEAAELLAKGVRVDLVKFWDYDNERKASGVTAGGRKSQEKRAAKFAAVGFTCPIIGNYNNVYFTGVSADVLEELRKDAEQVEEQRKAWEAAQKDGKTQHTAKAAEKAETTAEDTEAPAEGLELVEIAGGVAVVGDQRTTYRNRKQIKAHGARWNKDAQQWQGTTPEAVESLRRWFGVSEPEAGADTQTATENQEQPHTAQEQPETDTQTESGQDTTQAAEEASGMETATRFATLFADLVQLIEEVGKASRDTEKKAGQAKERAEQQANRQAEADQLRKDIATMSEKLAAMSDALRTMSERLAALEAETAAPQADGSTGEAGTHEPGQQPQERPERGTGCPDTLGMLKAAAEDVQRLTEDNNHTAAVLAQLYVLSAVGLRVRHLIAQLKAIEEAHKGRGYILQEEQEKRRQIEKEAEKRAALFLTPEEFWTLYGYTPGTTAKAA